MKILFIPHVSDRKIINRVYEFSKAMNGYFLNWELSNVSFKQKINSQVNSFFTKVELEDNLLSIPLLFKPQKFASYLNTKILNYAIKKYKIDIVVNANALLFDIKEISVPVIYDLVDDHLEVNSSIGLNSKRVEKIKRDIKDSLGVVCVTDILEEKVKTLNSKTRTIENGLYLDRFKQARSLKKELGLEGKRVFGYIGGVDEWTGIEFACEAYMKIKTQNDAFIIVGDSKSNFFKKIKSKYRKDILFIGEVSPLNVADYFKSVDIGLIPFMLNDFTHNAFPIKALEYGLAGSMVISTPLRVLKSKKLPFIKFCDIKDFDKLMKNIKKESFIFDFAPYSWQKQSDEFLSFIKELA